MKKSRRISNGLTEEKSLIFWIVMLFTVLFLLIAPFSQGLFNGLIYSFEGAIYSSVIAAAVTLIVISFKLFKSWSLLTHRDVLSILVLLIPLSYFISSLGAASKHLAQNEIYTHVLWVSFFLTGAYFANHSFGRKIIQLSIVGSGYVIVVYGLMNWFGNVNFKDAVLQGNRLSNVFQYPNTYAAYLVAILISTLILLNTAKKIKWQLVPALMIVPIMLSLMLTLSRGAFLIMPAMFVIYCCFIPWTKQVTTSIYIFISGGVSLFLFSRMISLREKLDAPHPSSISVQGWLLLISVSIIVGGAVIGIKKYVGQLLEHKYQQEKAFKGSNLIIPIVVVLIAAIAYGILRSNPGIIDQLPKEIQSRIEGINSQTTSVFSRNTFYKDAIQIASDYPLFGAGGGAWSTLYGSYKSYPYQSNQAHNFFVQYLVETGFVGLVILLIFIGYIYFIFFRKALQTHNSPTWNEDRLISPMISLTLLGHSIIDFDMSFAYLAAIVFLTMGVSASYGNEPLPRLERAQNTVKNQRWNRSYAIILAVVCIAILIKVVPAKSASAKFATAVEAAITTRSYSAFKEPLDSAIKLNPNHPDYALFKVDILKQIYQQTGSKDFEEEAWDLINVIEKQEPYNRQLIDVKYEWYKQTGSSKAALELVVHELDRHPWDITLYNKAISYSFEQGYIAMKSNNEKDSDFYWNNTIDAFNKLKNKIDHFNQFRNSSAKSEKNYFSINPQFAFEVGKVYYIKGEYDIAANTFEIGRVSSDFNVGLNKDIARWYLASLEKLDKKEENLLSLLLAADETEKGKIAKLVNRQFE